MRARNIPAVFFSQIVFFDFFLASWTNVNAVRIRNTPRLHTLSGNNDLRIFCNTALVGRNNFHQTGSFHRVARIYENLKIFSCNSNPPKAALFSALGIKFLVAVKCDYFPNVVAVFWIECRTNLGSRPERIGASVHIKPLEILASINGHIALSGYGQTLNKLEVCGSCIKIVPSIIILHTFGLSIITLIRISHLIWINSLTGTKDIT